MKINIKTILILSFFTTILYSCKEENCSNEVTLIGNQVWMIENLNTEIFRNGDSIFHAKTNIDWENAGKNKQPAWCYLNNKKSNGKKYGKLYNWYAVNDKRGLAPYGWRIASDSDWVELTYTLGGQSYAPEKLKYTTYWGSLSGDFESGSNSSGFKARPGGFRNQLGEFYPKTGNWWTSTESNDDFALKVSIGYELPPDLESVEEPKSCGYSVRCIKE